MKHYKYCFLLFLFVLIIFQGCTKEEIINIGLYDQEKVYYLCINKEQDFSLPLPQKTGYTFEGWFFDQKLQNKCTENEISNLKSKNVILYPKWTPNTYNITICYDEETERTIQAQFETEIKLIDYFFVKQGYVLSGWKVTGVEKTFNINDVFNMPAYDISLYPVISKKMVSFQTNGGDTISPIWYNDLIQNGLPVPQKEQCVFEGWFLDKNFSREFDIKDEPQNHITLYAKWRNINYNVSFETNGGSVISTVSYYELRKAGALPLPQKLGYDFEGWFFDENYQQKFDINIEPKNDITLYAKWKEKIYSITYIDNGGQANEERPKEFTIKSPEIKLPVLKKSGYKFLGWFEADKEYQIIPNGTSKDLVLEARWTERKPIKIEINTFPQKMNYFLNEQLESKGLTIDVIYDNDETELIDDISCLKLSGYDFSKTGWQIIIINYLGLTTSYQVFVTTESIIKIEAVIEKNEYIEGQELVLDDALILLHYNSGKISSTPLIYQYLADYDMNKIGRHKIIVLYDNFSTYFEINIKPKSLQCIEASGYKAHYEYMEELSNDGILHLIYDNETVEEIPLKNAIISGYDCLKSGEQKLLVQYIMNSNIFTCNIKVYVSDPPKTVSNLTIIQLPKTEYELGENLDVSNGLLKVNFHFYPGYEEIISLTLDMVSGFDSSCVQNLQLKVEYQGVYCFYNVSIIDSWSEIFSFIETQDGQGYIIKEFKAKKEKQISIPSMYNGKPVKEIGSDAFYNTILEHVVIPSNIVKIYSFAFYSNDFLTEIIIADRQTELDLELMAFEDSFRTGVYIECDLDKLNYGDFKYYSLTFYTYDQNDYSELQSYGFNAVKL